MVSSCVWIHELSQYNKSRDILPFLTWSSTNWGWYAVLPHWAHDHPVTLGWPDMRISRDECCFMHLALEEWHSALNIVKKSTLVNYVDVNVLPKLTYVDDSTD